MQMVDFLKQLVFFAFRIFNKVTNVTRKRCNGMRLKQDNRREWQQQQQQKHPTRVTKKWRNIIAYLTRSHEERESPPISDLQMKFKSTGNEANAGEVKVQQRGRVCWDYRRGNLKQCYAQYFFIKL